MNRRQFFGMTVASVAAAGLSPLVLPHRSIFLPPRYGWNSAALGKGYMREVEQYLINYDEFRYRYDAIGRDFWGTEQQFHVESKEPCPEVAARVIQDQFEHDGLVAVPPYEARQFRLALPTTGKARYI